MADVLISREAREQFESLPLAVKARVAGVFKRLEGWPSVSGAKPLRGDLAGSTGFAPAITAFSFA